MTDCVLIYVTAASHEEAQSIGRTVVMERLAACANLLGGTESYYHWDGKLEQGSEWLLVLKTTQAKQTQLIARIRGLHSYECPAIAALPIVSGHEAFLDWIRAEVEQPPS